MNLIERRRQMMMSKSLPYDAEVEYIGADGTQYIDTGIAADADKYDLEIELKLDGNTSAAAGVMSIYDDGRIYLLDRSSGNYITGKQDGTFDGGKFAKVQVQSTTKYFVIKAKLNNTSAHIEYGTSSNTNSNSTSRKSSNSFYFLNRHTVNSTQQRPFYGKCKYCKMWKDGVLVLDYIPVRVGQVGYMYDRVSGQLFGNQGTGNFILGPDKA